VERTSRLSRLRLAADRFVIHVGANVWYKNQPGLIRVFQRVAESIGGNDLDLVMVNSGLTPALGRLINECSLQSKVRVLTDIEPEDLCALYSSAAALLFPSLCEGFGWPIIEAQACGCPVFTSNRPPMTEVGGEGAAYIDPEDPAQAAATILDNLPRLSRMREAGFINVRRFSTEKMVAGYVRAYTKAMKSASALGSEEATEAMQASDSGAGAGETGLARQSV